ncbi:MAG TPA: asparagine synthase (glutamine-hydrolyzing) [Pirellulales bacterium]|nr:asparagine synthase (glutamine-hydrolyzing) [Pirellulales bacterium]
MCGITGAVWTDAGEPIDAATLARMTDVLAHRGPDDRGVYSSETGAHYYPGSIAGAALGFRRLSIIDLAGSNQPLANEDGSVWVVFNGEIYNYRTLRKRLEGSGHRFRTSGDTETLVHLYEDEGPGFVKHLEGMFALAIWDVRRRQLVLARDRLGKKPLVYRHEPERLLFASELKSLLEVPGLPREIDPSALDEYLTYQYVPHPNTIFRGYRKLPPGHVAVYANRRLSVEPYWRPDFSLERKRPAADYRAELREKLTAAVETRLQSDVPLGAFLSGGVDSSIVVGLMSRLSQEKVRTFSIGFPVAEFDETSYAREVAQKLGTIHQEFRVEPDGVAILPKLVWYYDEPFADSSAVPTYYVSKLTREHVTVALTGDGGDELFAGYPRYRAVEIGAWFDRLPRPVMKFLAGEFWQRLPSGQRQKSYLRKFKRLVGAFGRTPERRYLDWISIFNEVRRAEMYDESFIAQLPESDPFDFLSTAFARSGDRDPITAASLADLVTYLPCDLMTKVDIASMANSLECRAPFLDHHLVELAAAMPIGLKYRRGRGKRILIETFSDLLPATVRRRAKMGFGVPLGHWFRHELKDFTRDVLLDERALSRGYFRPDAIRQVVEDHQTGRYDHSYRLWALMVLELWQREWLDAKVANLDGCSSRSNAL